MVQRRAGDHVVIIHRYRTRLRISHQFRLRSARVSFKNVPHPLSTAARYFSFVALR